MGKIVKTDLYSDARQLIMAARQRVAVSINAELMMLMDWRRHEKGSRA